MKKAFIVASDDLLSVTHKYLSQAKISELEFIALDSLDKVEDELSWGDPHIVILDDEFSGAQRVAELAKKYDAHLIVITSIGDHMKAAKRFGGYNLSVCFEKPDYFSDLVKEVEELKQLQRQ